MNVGHVIPSLKKPPATSGCEWTYFPSSDIEYCRCNRAGVPKRSLGERMTDVPARSSVNSELIPCDLVSVGWDPTHSYNLVRTCECLLDWRLEILTLQKMIE